MKRHIPGLHSSDQQSDAVSRACSWSAWIRLPTAGIRRNPSSSLRFVVLEPEAFATQSFSGRLYCTERALWKLNWFLRDFGYDPELLGRDQVDEKALLNLRGVVRTSPIDLQWPLLPEPRIFRSCRRVGRALLHAVSEIQAGGTPMIFSHTQISQYPALSAQLSLPLSRWLAGKRNARRHGLRPLV